jgi:hypothetical protein
MGLQLVRGHVRALVFVCLVVSLGTWLTGCGEASTPDTSSPSPEDGQTVDVLVATESVEACAPYSRWGPAFAVQAVPAQDVENGAMKDSEVARHLVPEHDVHPGDYLMAQLLVRPRKC